jgi:hypothetical protein
MLETMLTISAQIHQQMPWIPRETPIYLIMDNARGHGTIAARDEYTRRLRNEHNVVIKFQPPCSPEVNALDLGIWMSLQSTVEHRNRDRRRHTDALAATVQEAWNDLPAETIQKLFDRIPLVHQLIVDSGSDYVNVEERRGRHNIALFVPE